MQTTMPIERDYTTRHPLSAPRVRAYRAAHDTLVASVPGAPTAHAGDWVVTLPSGAKLVLADEDFQALFSPVVPEEESRR